MSEVRQAAFAGAFYPDDPDELRHEVRGYIGELESWAATASPKAIIAPHAGYRYSGPVAGAAYACFRGQTAAIERVVLLGPSHRVSFEGLAVSDARCFATPLGEVPLDVEAIARVRSLSQVRVLNEAHVDEHCLEVHLPFLQEVLGRFRLVPLVVGEADSGSVSEVLEELWGGPETLIVVSSDLSHYHDWGTATEVDRRTARTIVSLSPVGRGDACGRHAINGLLISAGRRGLRVRALDVRNSGDTAGARERVVGYGAFAVDA